MTVHDNNLISYHVDGDAKQIVLHTEYPHADPPFKTDVVFTGVVDHYFRHPVLPSIIFDIERVELRETLEREYKFLKEGNRIGGWPSFWRESVDEMETSLLNNGVQMFEISSSYGLDGWVAARNCEFVKIVN